MAAAKVYTVTAPLVAATVGKTVLHFRAGDILPEGVSAESLENLKSLGFVSSDDAATDGSGNAPASVYDDKSKADLEGEIAARNADRADENKIVPEGKGNKPDLIAALVADDSK